MSAAQQPAGGKAHRSASGEGRRRLWASRRLAELYRLAAHRREHGVTIDEAPWSCALAVTLQAASRGPYSVGRGRMVTWRGLDLQELADAMRKSGFPALGLLDLAGEAGDCLRLVIDKVERAKRATRHREARGDKLGRWVGLTSEERIFCRITSMLAIDETDEERKARNADTKRARERERQRAKRAGKHRPQGESAARKKPWEAEGIARSTYYERLRNLATKQSSAAVETASATLATKQSRQPKSSPISGRTDLLAHPLRRSEGRGNKLVRRSSVLDEDADGIAAAIQCFHTPVI